MYTLWTLLLLLGVALANDAQTVFSSPSTPSSAHGDGLRLVQLDVNASTTRWLSRDERRALRNAGVYFKDITDHQDFLLAHPTLTTASHTQPAYPTPSSSQVPKILSALNASHAEAHVAHLSALHTRWYESDTGLAASEYLHSVLAGYVDAAPDVPGRVVTLRQVKHNFKQFSVALRIANAADDDAKKAEVAIVGAHLDSASRFGDFERAPGADDDASGTSTVLEAARLLLRSRYTPARGRAVELHLYAGEEAGLLGSQDVARAAFERGVRVRGMLQFDMTAWIADKNNEHVGINMARTPALGAFSKLLVERYLSIPWAEEYTYPWGASDSASWADLGYPASDALEGTWPETRGHLIHSENDNMHHAEYSFAHMMEFVKLAVAFLVELGGEAAEA